MEIELNPKTSDFYEHDLSLEKEERENGLYINGIINEHLGKYSSKWFAEYSVLATTIDPLHKSKNKLRCFSFIKDNGEVDPIEKKTFKDKVEEYVSSIIYILKDNTPGQNNNWWFHNPETFLAPTQIKPYVSFTDNGISVDAALVERIRKHSEEKRKEQPSKSNKYRGDRFFSYSSMEYPRSFSDILEYSKTLFNSQKSIDAINLNANLVQHYHNGVEEARLYYDYFTAKEGETFCYLTFPIIASHARFITPTIYKNAFGDGFLNDRFQGLGHCFIYFRIDDPSSIDINELSDSINQLFEAINNALHNFAFNYTFNIGLLLQEKSKKEAERTAKSAIMSRNMSHNLGSHVMAYLKQKMGSVASIMSSENNVLKYLDLSNGTHGDVELPFLVGLGRFIGYIQERQDYIATIATDYIPYGAPVNMKDAIYDELNPDLRYMRHKSDEKNRPMNILLSYIAKSEGLSRENMDQRDKVKSATDPTCFVDNPDKFKTNHDILFGFVSYFEGKNGTSKEVFGLSPSKCYSDNAALDKMRKINFSLPGGLIGRQAVFSIVENIIRNAAKHGDLQSVPNGNLCFTFDVLDCNRLDINDVNHEPALEERICSPVWRQLYQTAPGREMMYLLTITDNLDYSQTPDVAEKLIRGGLREPYIDVTTGQMTESNKGIKEIRISSAWLRREADEEQYVEFPIEALYSNNRTLNYITPPNKRMPLVAVEMTKDNHLRYMIALRKNRLVAVIGESLSDRDIFEEIASNSPIEWRVFDSVKQFIKDNQDNYRYILVANRTVFNELRPFVSNRVFIWNEHSDNRNKYNTILSLKKSLEATIDEESIFHLKESLEMRVAELTKSVLSQIYRSFTNLSDSGPDFYICDNSPSILEHIQYGKIKVLGESTEVTIEELDENGKHKKNGEGTNVKTIKKVSDIAEYEYRTHHATQHDYISYWLKKNGLDKDNPGRTYGAIKSIDGITGDNSSDRLVRREPLNEEWYFSHLRALKQKVAIIDERIFKIVHNVDETHFVTPSIPGLKQVLDGLKKGLIDKDVALIRITRLAKGVIDTGIITGLNDSDIPTICSTLEKYNTSKFNAIHKHGNHLSSYYSGREVEVFSIVKDEKGTFAIIGCVDCHCNSEEDLFDCTFDRIATLSWSANRAIISFTKDEYEERFGKAFDFISIHQGILDKIYEGFDIKEYLNGENDEKKGTVTKAVHNTFMSSPDVIKVEKGNKNVDFLPRFIIHSGRSKPTKIDMPQHLPFVQYAAIEHGVKDCKYSLIEVLDYARFEDVE